MPCVADSKRRGYGEDSIYFDHASDCRDGQHHRGCQGRWRGSVSLGFGADGRRIRRKVSGRTKTEIKDKLQLLHDELREESARRPDIPSITLSTTGWHMASMAGRPRQYLRTGKCWLP